MSAEAAAHAAIERARTVEDVVVGDEITRHTLRSRAIHWAVAVFFVSCVLTGLPVWSPVFGWMAAIFGGLSVCRWLHAWLGIAFAASSILMAGQWFRDMLFDEHDRSFKVIEYMKFSGEDPEVGKYNAGQKFFFWAALLGALALLLSGIVLWYPMSFGQDLRVAAIILHDIAFIAFFVAVVGHIYLGTAAEPGTFRSMTRGTVSKAWARLHHPRWYRGVTGEEKGR